MNVVSGKKDKYVDYHSAVLMCRKTVGCRIHRFDRNDTVHKVMRLPCLLFCATELT